MIETREFSYDPATGIRKWFHYDHSNDTFTIESVQDAGSLIEENLLHRNASPENWQNEGHGVRVAQLPLHVWADLKQRGIIDDKKAFARWLNDRDNQYYRTKLGRV